MTYKLIIFTILFSINITTSFSGEVDNYLAWGHEIQDETVLFNKFLNSRINRSLGYLNDLERHQKYYYGNKCEKVARWLMRSIGCNYFNFAALNTEFEVWAQEEKEVDSYPVNTTSNGEMRKISLYGPKPSFIEWFFLSIDRVVNVGGVYFGTDKFSHFAGSGYLYYKNYLKAQKKGKNKLDALKYAIKKGHLMEGGIIGIKSTGVFSYADLEANFQGMLMAIDMCEGDNPLLKKVAGDWILDQEIKFQDYVNPNWDESYNVSGYTSKRVGKMIPMIENNGYCEQMDGEWVKNKWLEYEDYFTSQKAELRGRTRLIDYSLSTILKMESADREMRKLLDKNGILSQDAYTLDNFCTNLEKN